MTNVTTVFIVDDDLSARKGLARLIRTASYDVRDFASVDDFLDSLSSDVHGCVVLDAGMSGLRVCKFRRKSRRAGLHLPIIVVTAHDDPETRRKAKKMNAVGFFRKPVDGPALLDAIDWALRASNKRAIA